jgi:DNA-binding response OmpR family regulator
MARSLTHAGLHCAGFGNCDGATEGESAVQMTRIQRYDLIILSDPSPPPPPKSGPIVIQHQQQLSAAVPAMSIVDTARAIRSFEEKAGEAPLR